MRKISWFAFLLPLLVACSGNSNKLQKEIADARTSIEADTMKSAQSSFYFNGDFIYMADAASLLDCITAEALPVAMKGDYIKVEKKYKDLKPEPLEAINCSVMGYLIDKPANEEGPAKQLVITALIGFDRTVRCNPKKVITNDVYAHYSPNDKNAKTKTSLTLDSDYTYQCTVYQLSPIKLISQTNGHWHRMAMDNIVFLVDGNVLYEGTIDFNSMNLILQNDNEKEVIFKKGA